ncbi:DNA polymerase nu isoform X2 [Carassius auratus]|uniref:DNA-directed DNA polymerase n=1 Tax=Carassius auratus TaxID=7957 RepID=A0A6P6PNR8_CARAU|nr:DNA polymerase nu isoform X2 [Carassius auratus]
MESYLSSSLNTAPLSAAAQRVIAALRVQYVHRTDRSRASLSGRSFGLSQQQGKDDRNQDLFAGKNRTWDSNDLVQDSNHFKLKDVTSNEKFALYSAGDMIKPNVQPYIPVAQGEDSLHMFRLNTIGSPQARPDFMTEAEDHRLTFRKRSLIQPASPSEKVPVGCDQHEAPPVKKFSFGQLTFPTNNCHPASGEKEKRINIVDKQQKPRQTEFWSCRSGLTAKDSCESVFEDISKEARADQAVFIQVRHSNHMSNVEKPTSKSEDLESSHYWKNSKNSELSLPVESCVHAEICGSVSVIECVQDIPVSSGEIQDSVEEKEDSGCERRTITKSRTNSPQPEENAFLMPVGERDGKVESTVPQPSDGVQHSIQPHSQAGEMKSFPKHKWEPLGPSQEAPKIISSQELRKKTLRALRFPSQLFHKAKVKGSIKLLKPKLPQPNVKRQRHPLRPQKVLKRQGCNKPNHSKSPKLSDPRLSGSKRSNEMPSETDRKEDGTTATTKGAFSLTSDHRVCDTGHLSQEERQCLLEEAGKVKAFVVTMVYQDGTTQLDPEQLRPSVCGLLVLLKRELDSEGPQDKPPERVLYLRLEQAPAWAQQDCTQKQDVFTREMLMQMMCDTKPFVCFKAKDLLRTALKHFSKDLSWKQVLECHVMDPQIAAWLLDPADSASCFQTLLYKHYSHSVTSTSLQPVLGQAKVTQVISNLSLLYNLMVELHNKLQTQGLWQLYSGIEQMMIPILAVMESYKIHVDKEAMKKTSELLGSKLKQLEQEAHQAAGQKFLVSSSAQLRLILFEKLRLHEICENKKLPKTIKKQQSTSETALLQLQKLHPLPKIILEYRQIHKNKTAFVDGILSCMSKTFISSTWNQTSTVSGRLSAKHPNFQALPKQPLQITKEQYIPGKISEIVTVHPRAMFIPREGWTFLSADFCQVELRLLAHLSADPQLLRIFQNTEADAFTMLAAQWKGVSEDRVSLEDREHAKRIVYSVVYGAGRERLSGILGVSAEEASRFQDTFLQTYREVPAFIQHTIQYCHKQGFVKSIMGRRRSLPQIHSADWSLRNQAERQAVNFVLQGSAADLAKMAMIKICSQVASAPYTARLVAQIHDELLFEVEFSQLEQFAVLVKKTMESLQHVEHLGVNLSVPLKVSMSTGPSWGSLCDMNLPCTTTATSL